MAFHCLSLSHKIRNFAYSVFSKTLPSYLSTHLQYTPKAIHLRRPTRTPLQDFVYAAPRTGAWENSFTVTAKKLLNSLAITEFDVLRLKGFKTWCFQLFLLLEIESWHTESIFEGYRPLTAISSLPCPALPSLLTGQLSLSQTHTLTHQDTKKPFPL